MLKSELRKLVKSCKSHVTMDQMLNESKRVFDFIEQLPQFQKAENVLLYYSLPDELPTHSIVDKWCESKNVFLPRVNGEDLDVVPYSHNLKDDNRFHIGEPQGNPVSADLIDLIIAPAVALDSKGNRLGRGKGFYDRLLSKTRAYTIGVALECQLVDLVPTQEHDIKLDAIVTSDQHFII